MNLTGLPIAAAEVFEGREWFVLQTAPLKERLAVRQLWANGIDVFWPHYLAAVRHRVGNVTRRGYALRSWFPRYMFVAEGPKFSAGMINNLMGVSTLIYVGDRLLGLPDDVVWEIKSLADPSGLVPQSKIGPSNMVEVKGEHFVDCLKRLGGLKARIWAAGMTATERQRHLDNRQQFCA